MDHYAIDMGAGPTVRDRLRPPARPTLGRSQFSIHSAATYTRTRAIALAIGQGAGQRGNGKRTERHEKHGSPMEQGDSAKTQAVRPCVLPIPELAPLPPFGEGSVPGRGFRARIFATFLLPLGEVAERIAKPSRRSFMDPRFDALRQFPVPHSTRTLAATIRRERVSAIIPFG